MARGYFACLQSSSSDLILAKITFTFLFSVSIAIFELCDVLLHEKNPQYLKALSIYELFFRMYNFIGHLMYIVPSVILIQQKFGDSF